MAYPIVARYARDGTPQPGEPEDMRMVAAFLSAFGAFFAMYRQHFASDFPEPVSVSYTDDDDVVVRFTLPYAAFDLFEDSDASTQPAKGPTTKARSGRRTSPRGTGARLDADIEIERPPSTRRPRVGRNELCPCGSRKKYKHCHLEADESAHATFASAALLHDMDRELVMRILRFTLLRFGDFEDIVDFDSDCPGFAELLLTWGAYRCEVDGRSLAEWFRSENGRSLSRAQHDWLDSQQRTWLSVWEVTSVRPGEGLALRDLLTGETREVVERNATESLRLRHAILARVVDHNGMSLLCGVHPRPLQPFAADDVVRRIRARLRRKRLVSVDKLHPQKVQGFMVTCWDDAVEEEELKWSIPPVLQNTDGHDLVPTVDTFSFDKANRDVVIESLRSIEGASPANDEDDVLMFLRTGNALHKSWDNTIVGRADVLETDVRLETNSSERADELRLRVEDACKGLLRYRHRTETDLEAALADHADESQPAAVVDPRDPPDPALTAQVQQEKCRYYEAWLDDSIPALEGMSPRTAVRTRRGREMVELLLKDMEHLESRAPEEDRFDFDRIRHELRLF